MVIEQILQRVHSELCVGTDKYLRVRRVAILHISTSRTTLHISDPSARSSTFQPANHYADPIHDRFTAKEPTMRFTAALAFLATFAGLVSADCAFQGNGVDCTTAANDVQCGTCGEYIYRCEDKQCQSIIF